MDTKKKKAALVERGSCLAEPLINSPQAMDWYMRWRWSYLAFTVVGGWNVMMHVKLSGLHNAESSEWPGVTLGATGGRRAGFGAWKMSLKGAWAGRSSFWELAPAFSCLWLAAFNSIHLSSLPKPHHYPKLPHCPLDSHSALALQSQDHPLQQQQNLWRTCPMTGTVLGPPHIISFGAPKMNSLEGILLSCHFTNEKSAKQRGYMICPRSCKS